MRAPQSSPEWRKYWQGGGAQAYLKALQTLEAADAAPPPTPAGGADAPEQAATPMPPVL
jgi:hypothetical protein